MSHRTLQLCIFLLASLAVAAAAPARAGLDAWSFGGAFNIGNVHFRVGYAHAEPYGPSYYFEATRPIAYPAVSCSRRCYRNAGRHYHHQSCPLVRRHFALYGYEPNRMLYSHGPRDAYSHSDPYIRKRHHGKRKGRFKVPAGHLPPPGACRVWFPGRPPGHQPPPTDCVTAQYSAPPGTYILHGPPVYRHGPRH